jgi:hypothetical protein
MPSSATRLGDGHVTGVESNVTAIFLMDQTHRKSTRDDPHSKSRRQIAMQLKSMLTCPRCAHQAIEAMPTDACQFFYDCKGCGERLKPKQGDCCVFCSYGSVPCPPIQAGKRG